MAGDVSPDIDDLLRYVVGVLERLEISYAIGGSNASMYYGEPRGTLDIDIVAKFESGDLPALRAAFPEPHFYLSEEAAETRFKNKRCSTSPTLPRD